MSRATHPTTVPGGWAVADIVYAGSAGEVAIALVEKNGDLMLAMRWCEGDSTGQPRSGTSTEWFVLPFTFASAIGRSLCQMKATGFPLEEKGFARMVKWLEHYEGIDSALCF